MTDQTTTQDAQQTQSFYDRISKAYDFIADAGEHKAREKGEEALRLQDGESVLEIGFGTGNSVVELAQRVGAQGHVQGIDISPGMRDVAEGKVREAGVSERVELRVGDARDLPYEDNRFDAVFLSFTLELFPQEDMAKVLSEIRRVLRDGGRLGVVSMAKVQDGEDASLLEKTYIWMHQHFPHIVDCRPIAVEDAVTEAGFRIQTSEELTIWTMPVHVVVGVKG